MAFLIPSSIQKRLLRYALSHFPVVDTDTLDLEQLDIAWGKTSSVELRDVGLHVKKLSHMLHLPDELQPTKARIVSLRITVPADIYNSGIAVDVQGIDIQVRLDRPRKGTATPSTPKANPERKRAEVQTATGEEEHHDHIPTAQELAESFLNEEPADEREELAEAIQNAGLLPSEESDSASETSDEDNAGTGVGLAVPAFLANFLKGVIDRLQMSISNVKFILDAELHPDEDLPMHNPAVSLQFGVASVAIDGFTHDEQAQSDIVSNNQKLDRRRVRLQGIYGDLLSERALFTSLEKVSTASSRQSPDVSPRVPQGSEHFSASHISPSASHLSRRPRTAVSESSRSTASQAYEPLADSRTSFAAREWLRGSIHSQDRFADASDDGHDDLDESIHESKMYTSSSLATSQIAPFEPGEDIEADLPFMMDDAQSPYGYDSQELDPFTALSNSYDEQTSLRTRHPRRTKPFATTVPMTPLRSTDSYRLDRRQPIYNSHPVPCSSRGQMLARPHIAQEDSPPAQSSPPKSDSSGSPSEVADASLAQSMMFSHEEAQSMYMSAMSVAPNEQYHIPGGWDRNSSSSDGSNGTRTGQVAPKIAPPEPESSGVATPRPKSPSNGSSSPDCKFRGEQAEGGEPSTSSHGEDLATSQRINTVSKRLFSVDELLVWLPWTTKSDGPESAAASDAPISHSLPQQRSARPMPGAFSQYQSVFSEKFKTGQNSSVHARFDAPEESMTSLAMESVLLSTNQDPSIDIAVEIDKAMCHLDTSSTRLMYRLVQQVLELWSSQAQPTQTKHQEQSSPSTIPSCRLTLQRFTFGFMDNIPTDSGLSTPFSSASSFSLTEPLFQTDVEGLSMSNSSTGEALDVKLELQTFRAGYPGEPIISFDKSSRRQSLSKSKTISKDADVKIIFRTSSSRGAELDIFTLPVLLALKLQKLDDRLLMFGGVSGILDLSSSVASNSTVLAPSPVTRTKPGNVRFGDDFHEEETPVLSPIKLNARFYGVKVMLEGKTCAVSLDTGTLAVTLRKDTARVKIEHIKLQAPFNSHTPAASALTVDLVKSDVRFLMSGVEDDFESLVSLIEPSGDRYEDDDGFLLDMLKRQRKNGSVLRVNIADVQANIAHLEHTDKLQQLADELGRLSSGVTKYLPEDDRPGILILPKIASCHVQVRINDKLGLLEASCEDIQAAYVGTPLLLGFKIGATTASRDNDVVLDPLLQLDAKTSTPSVMGRFIGNIPEPRIKLKFFNLLVEYKIPTILAILGIAEMETVEELAISMVASIATVRAESSPAQSEIVSPARRSESKKLRQPLRLDVFVRDCAIGLNPAKSDAKSLFLLSQAHITADEADKDRFQICLHLKRASLLLIDDVEALNLEIAPAPRPYDSDNLSPAIDDLTHQGFQPVASIWSCQTVFTLTKDDKGETLIDVNINNKLFTLETCADSQQTLAAVLGGLVPPLPKKEEHMYRTHVVPIENMMASFTGEPFVQGESEAASEQIEEDLNMEDADQILEDIPSNMDFVGSFYDPEDDTGQYNPSALTSVNRLSSRLLAPTRNEKVSFADGIEERFEHGPDDVIIDPLENYLEVFKFKSSVRRWDSKTARLEPIYETDVKGFPVKVTAKFEQITWNLYDGYDWGATRDKIARAVEKVEAQVEQRRRARRSSARDDDEAESEIADMLFQSIWIAVPPNADERDLRRGINRQIMNEYSETASTRTTSVDTRTTGGRPIHKQRKSSKTLHLERSRRKISFDLQRVIADVLILPSNFEETQNSLALRVGEFEIYDHVPSSTWKKFMTYLHDVGERQMGKSMIRLDAITVKPVADLAATEMIIKASLLPIRLHVDQDALDFMTRFFEFKDDKAAPSSGASGPYIARLEINTIPVQLDYKPKKIDYAGLRSGSTSEFANFVILDRAEFQLKRLILYGVQSPDLLHSKLKSIWTADVINNQLPTVLAGLSGIRPFVDVGSGIRDLVVVPMREYRKDGRVVRSIQKGAVAFAKTTTSELARLGAKFAIGTQTVLEGAEGLLSPSYDKRSRSHSSDEWNVDDFSTSPAREEQRAVSNYADQPLNVVTGLRDAWQGLERDLATAKDAIIAIGGDVRDSGSAFGAVGAVARLAPTVILRPAIGATRGVGMALLGTGNMLDKESRRKIEDKYKRY